MSGGLSPRELQEQEAARAGHSHLQLLEQKTPVPSPSFEPTRCYAAKDLDGWLVRIHRQLMTEHSEAYNELIRVLHVQLYQITRVVPPKALASLRQVPIWAEWNEPLVSCAGYLSDSAGLRQHGMNPDKANCIEIGNTLAFLKLTLRYSWIALHELAHAYHHKVLKDENPEILAAYETAVKSGTYEAVLNYSGNKARHYALTNYKEYFAECTTAYFGTNCYYPFVRPELKLHDPTGFRMIEKLWGVIE